MNAITLGQLLSMAGSQETGAPAQEPTSEGGDALLAALFATALAEVLGQQQGDGGTARKGTDGSDTLTTTVPEKRPESIRDGAPNGSSPDPGLLRIGVPHGIPDAVRTDLLLGRGTLDEPRLDEQLPLLASDPESAGAAARLADLQGRLPLTGTGPAALDPLRPDPELLNPEFRARLERVIQRMAAEHGHTVRIVEGYRSPERQEALFAQGRSQPGEVVTWTQASRHMEGLAADVIVDGTYDERAFYRRLARIADQEGLRTLPGDEGHIEWPGRAERAEGRGLDSLRATAPNRPKSLPEGLDPSGRVARPAPVAEVADVARVARTARIVPASEGDVPAGLSPEGNRLEARGRQRSAGRPSLGRTDIDGAGRMIDGRPIRSGGDLDDSRRIDPSIRDRQAIDRRSADPAPIDPTGVEAADESPAKLGRAAAAEPVPAADVRAERPSATAGLETTVRGPGPANPAVASTDPVAAAGGAERVQQIQDLQDARPAGALKQITVQMNDADGESGLMRVRLDGGRIDATVGVRDLQQAGRLQSRIGDLQQSLRVQGLEPGSLQAHAIGSVLDPAAAVESIAQRAATRFWTGGDAGSDAQNQNHESRGRRDPNGSPNDTAGRDGSRGERRGDRR